MPKHLAQVNSTVPNMERYGHKCQIKQIIFYSTFSLSSQYFIQLFLSSHKFVSLQPVFSLSFFFKSNSLTLIDPLTLTDQAAAIASGLKTPLLLI